MIKLIIRKWFCSISIQFITFIHSNFLKKKTFTGIENIIQSFHLRIFQLFRYSNSNGNILRMLYVLTSFETLDALSLCRFLALTCSLIYKLWNSEPNSSLFYRAYKYPLRKWEILISIIFHPGSSIWIIRRRCAVCML